jgi:oligosaccharide repeat unit polymerase
VEAWLIPIYTIFALVAYFEHDGSKSWRWRAWAWIAVALLYQLLSTAQSGVMLLMVGLVAVTWVKRRRAPLRFLVLCIFGFVTVFIANQIILHKGGASTDLSISENAPALLEGFANYGVGGLVGFDAVVSNPLSVKNTWKLYKFFVDAANKLGADYPELPQNLQYTPISPKLATNVYTIYFPYYDDFGLLGVAALSFLIGAVSTVVYCLAVRLRPLGVILFCTALYGIVMSVFAELFFLEIGFWLKSVAIVCALYYLPPILGRSSRVATLRRVRT